MNPDIPEENVRKYGLIKRPRKLRLYNALKAGYARNPKRASKYLKKFGYIVDDSLSDSREFITAYSPFENKVIHISNGTNIYSPKDLGTDLLTGLGSFKDTARYKDEKNALTKAREKYKDAKIVLAGHSLAGQVLHNIASPSMGDKSYTYNPAYAPNQKVRPGFYNVRTTHDVFSAFAPEENTITLPNQNKQIPNRPIQNILKAHELENIRNEAIFL
jgi:hypothetical protein